MDKKLSILVFVLSTALGDYQENFKHRTFNKNPGIIFEKIADAHIYNAFIELHTIVDLDAIETVRAYLIINQRKKFNENHEKGLNYLMPFIERNGWHDWIIPNSHHISQDTLSHYLPNTTFSNKNSESLLLENAISKELALLLKITHEITNPSIITLNPLEERYNKLVAKMSSILNMAQIDKIDSQLFPKGYLNSKYEEMKKSHQFVFPKLENEDGILNCKNMYQLALLHRNDTLIITIRLPKVENESYSIYKQHVITSFVNLELTIASTFRIYHDYFIRDKTGTKILFINETQLNNQEQCNNYYYLKNLVFYSKTCESNLFENSDDSLCATRELVDSETQVLRTNRGLIYSTPYHSQARIQCTKYHKELKLIKIGIIELGPNCKFIFQGKIFPGTAWPKTEVVIPEIDLQMGDLERFFVTENYTMVTTTPTTPVITAKPETRASRFLLATSLVLTIINLAILVGQYCASKPTPKKIKVEPLL